MCLLRYLKRANDFVHIAHFCGFSPEWVSWCSFKLLGVEKFFNANVLLRPVGEHVLIKISQQAKGFVADFALVWFLFPVGYHVSLETTITCKCLVAHFTFVGLYPSVNELVSFEMMKMGEGLVALSALERLLSTVDSHVPHQIVGITK